MDKHFYFELADRYLNGTATPEEQKLVEAYYEQLSSQDAAYPFEKKQQLKEEIYKAIQQSVSPTARVVPMRRWWKVAIAASFIIAIATWFVISTKEKSQPPTAQTQQQRFKNDILPVNQGAILTLSDGSTIYLDSAVNGVLTQQGNVKVTKQGEQIVYNASHSPLTTQHSPVFNTMATQKGKQYMLLLADGSKAYLNAASSITYPNAFTGKERNVEITGEVYFEIAHNASMPFKVKKKGSDATIEVLGTHFNVNAYDDEAEIKVTLLEGSVRVISNERSEEKSRTAVVIKPGQQAVIAKNEAISLNNSIDVEQTLAWKNNLFWFTNEDLPTIMRELARWYDAEIVFQEKPTSRYGFVLERNLPISKLLQVLELTGGVHFKIEGKKVTVMK